MKKFIALLLCFSVMCQLCVVAHAEEIIPYDEDEVIDFEFPGYYDEELGRIVMYEELGSPYIFGADDAVYFQIGAVVLSVLCGLAVRAALNAITSVDFAKANMAFWDSASQGISDASKSVIISVGKLFQRGQAITFSAISGISDAISELKQSIVDIAAAQGIPDFSFTKGSAGSLSYSIDSGDFVLQKSEGGWRNSKMMTQPWLYAVDTGVRFFGQTINRNTYRYFWHGIGTDDYGSYWFYCSIDSLLGYSLDNLECDSVASLPSSYNSSIRKFYLSSQAAYNSAISTGSGAYFLTDSSSITDSGTWYGATCGYYASNGSVSLNAFMSMWGGYEHLSTAWVTDVLSVPLEIEYDPLSDKLVVPESGVIDFSVPDGLTLDTSDVGELLITLPQTVADRLDGSEASKAEESEKQGILQNIYDTVVSIPEAIGAWITDIPGILQAAEQAIAQEIEEAAPVQLFKDKCLSIELIYNAGADFLNGILDLEPEPPVIYVDMTKSRSQIIKSDNDKIPILDMHFYEEYKPYGDKIISGILWAFFLFRLWMRAPDIVSGAGMVATSVAEAASDDKKRKVK